MKLKLTHHSALSMDGEHREEPDFEGLAKGEYLLQEKNEGTTLHSSDGAMIGRLAASHPRSKFRVVSDSTHHHVFALSSKGKIVGGEDEDDPGELARRTEAWEGNPRSVEPTKPASAQDAMARDAADRRLCADGDAPMPQRLRALQRLNERSASLRRDSSPAPQRLTGLYRKG